MRLRDTKSKIDIWVEEDDLEFKPDGSYEAAFGYESTFPIEVTISKTGNMEGRSFGCLPEDWNEVKRGFVAEDEYGKYIVPGSDYVGVTTTGENRQYAVAYLDNNFYSWVYYWLREVGLNAAFVE